LPVIRRYDLHDDAYYVLRRADSRPLAVPAWMTRPEAAYAEIIPTAHLEVSIKSIGGCAATMRCRQK